MLYLFRGVNEQGSLRNIQPKRNGIVMGLMISMIFSKGKIDRNLKLQDGDIIFILSTK